MKKDVDDKLSTIRELATEYSKVAKRLYDFLEDIDTFWNRSVERKENAREFFMMSYIQAKVDCEKIELKVKYPRVRKQVIKLLNDVLKSCSSKG